MVLLPMADGLFGTVGMEEVVVAEATSVMGCVADWDTTGVDAAAPLLTSQGFGGDGMFCKKKKKKERTKQEMFSCKQEYKFLFSV